MPDSTKNVPQLFLAGIMLNLAGALIGFLLHSRPPALIYMGDAGSYFVGFLIAVSTLLAAYVSYEAGSNRGVLAPLLIMGVPLYDMFTVLCIRWNEGRSLFRPDKSHFSHRLVALGLTKAQAVLTVYVITATCCLAALLLQRVEAIGAGILVMLVFCAFTLIATLELRLARRRTPLRR